MRVTVLASGSGGNATLIEAGATRILVDAGISPRVLARKLAETGAGGAPTAIVITHAHRDHVGNCAALAAKLGIPVYASESTARVAPLGDRRGVREFGARTAFTVGDVTVSPLPVPHDAAQVALTFAHGDRRAGIVTDLGEVPPALLDHVRECDVLLMESNHDPEMLASGPYPLELKRRIASARGHLSNAQACELLRALSRRTRTVVLMHLSETNNAPRVALGLAHDALAGRDIHLHAAKQDDTLVIELRANPACQPREQLSLALH